MEEGFTVSEELSQSIIVFPRDTPLTPAGNPIYLSHILSKSGEREDFLKKNQNAPRPSGHPPVRGGKCQNV